MWCFRRTVLVSLPWSSQAGDLVHLRRSLPTAPTVMPTLQGHYSEADARTVFHQVILAIQYLHSQGIVHR